MPPPDLIKYMDVPAIVEIVNGAQPDLTRVAVAAMEKASRIASAARAKRNYALPSDVDSSALSTYEYRGLVKSIQARIDAELTPVPNYVVKIIDNSGNAISQVTDAIGNKAAGAQFRFYYQASGGGGLALPYMDPRSGKTICFVIGLPQSRTMHSQLQGMHDMSAGAATEKEWQTIVQWHEVGHCMMGRSELHADTFGLLMAVQAGVSRDAITVVATMREGDELLSSELRDDHVTSPAAIWVAQHYEKLRANPEFMKLDINGMASFANDVATRLDISPSELRGIATVRKSIDDLFNKKAHWLRTSDGLKSVGAVEWITANASKSPIFARVADLISRASGGAPVVPTPFHVDLKAYVAALEGMAKAGDPTANSMLASVRNPTDVRHVPEFDIAPFRTAISPLAGKFFEVEHDAEIRFSPDQSGFAAVNADGSIHLADLNTGQTRTLRGAEPAHQPGR